MRSTFSTSKSTWNPTTRPWTVWAHSFRPNHWVFQLDAEPVACSSSSPGKFGTRHPLHTRPQKENLVLLEFHYKGERWILFTQESIVSGHFPSTIQEAWLCPTTFCLTLCAQQHNVKTEVQLCAQLAPKGDTDIFTSYLWLSFAFSSLYSISIIIMKYCQGNTFRCFPWQRSTLVTDINSYYAWCSTNTNITYA